MFLWSVSSLPFGVYAISQRFNIPLQIQPQFFGLFCCVSWGQCTFFFAQRSRTPQNKMADHNPSD